MDPKASENDAAKASTGSDAGKSRKTRPKIEIDLPASAIRSEASEEATPEPSVPEPSVPQSETPSPGRSPKLLPSLLGLVAGAIGGFGAWHGASLMDGGIGKLTAGLDQRLTRLEQARPASPNDLAERLLRAERSLAETGPREQALRVELGKVQAAISAEQAERAKALAALGERTVSPAGSEAITPRLDEMQTRLNSVSERVASLAKSSSQTSAGQNDLSRASALVLATGLLDEAFRRHETLGGIPDMLRAMGIEAEMLAPLMPYVSTPPVSAATLLAEFRTLATQGSGEASTEGTLFERLKTQASRLVEIRRTGEIVGTDDAALLARAEQALSHGNVAQAFLLTGQLTPKRAEIFTPWRLKAEQRIAAIKAIGQLRTLSLDSLARAASGKK